MQPILIVVMPVIREKGEKKGEGIAGRRSQSITGSPAASQGKKEERGRGGKEKAAASPSPSHRPRLDLKKRKEEGEGGEYSPRTVSNCICAYS